MNTETDAGQAPAAAQAPHEHRELVFAILAGVAYFTGLILEYLVKADTAAWIAFLATYFFGGFYTIQEVIASIRRRRFEVDFLMIVAAIGAASIGRWAEGAVLLFLFSLGHALEEVAMAKARASIEALAAMMPRVARVRRDQAVIEVAVDDLVPGDVCVVRGDDRIPADGIVIAGSTAVDQSSVTGESIPVDKVAVTDRARAQQAPDTVGPESTVFSGTVNGSGGIDVLVTRRAEDSTLARLVQLVREAESSKSPTQRFLDRFQRWYIPAVLLLVITVFLVGAFVLDRGFSPSFYLAMVVLVAGSPCALAIATPSAILAGVARAARAGVLVKGGGPLENLGRIQVAYFDKTGTLTWGRPRVTDIRTAPGVSEAELRRTAYAVERLSGHPLAAAVVRDLRPEDADSLPEATDVESVTGLGVRARFEGQEVQVGSPRMWAELPPAVGAMVGQLQADGRTIMIVGTPEKILGVVGLMDPPRAESAPMVNSLRDAGVEQIVMLSGDHQQVASAVGRDVGADEVRGGLMPEDKVGAVATTTRAGTRSAMIGDGVNDAPAMANSTVGIAMGAAGSPVALETAEVALMSDDIGRLPFIVRLSRQTSRIIRINLIFSLVVVIGLVTLSLLGLGIGPAVLVHEGSTIVVVLIALTLLRFQVGREHEGIEHEAEPRS
ncbi:cadmium-translocating P-type ATPase [Enemella evansiae]|uniref:heavy metal translocating P-type ATPase n=1 Tax=Enemella evansiae TaxID=2016499 RepID=UPI000B974AD1|nr:heavy metal translocating P-type ATPase [Enemella evansiae]OYO07587.1 cadmium-translocating P-type ATPase [Enemella evansiae]